MVIPSQLESVWDCLRRVSNLEIGIEERRLSTDTVVHWQGHGQVEVQPCGAGNLDLIETGIWDSGPGKGLSFRNVYRWSLEAGALSLAHLRRGPTQPVDLLTLRMGADGVFVSEEPFACGRDLYSGSLARKGQSLELAWTIRGPSKCIECWCIYS